MSIDDDYDSFIELCDDRELIETPRAYRCSDDTPPPPPKRRWTLNPSPTNPVEPQRPSRWAPKPKDKPSTFKPKKWNMI